LRCERRAWLLGALSGPLDLQSRDRWRMLEALALEDVELIDALGGARKASLHAEHREFAPRRAARGVSVERLCRHDDRYPPRLRSAGAPAMLNVLGGAARLASLARNPAVAVLGTKHASDYGMQTARSLTRGLALSGVTIATALDGGVAASARRGAADVGASGIAVCGSGLQAVPRAARGALHACVAAEGCVVSELPDELGGRRWGQLAALRTVVALASAVVVVEARDTAEEMLGPALARSSSIAVAAVPGRVSSPLAAGPHALLRGGARLVRCPEDVLDLLCESGAVDAASVRAEPSASFATSDPRARTMLDRVAAGWDTVERLMSVEDDFERTLATLSELEVLGLLVRGDGGRYVPRCSTTPRAGGE
jgi:DNA processing protein